MDNQKNGSVSLGVNHGGGSKDRSGGAVSTTPTTSAFTGIAGSSTTTTTVGSNNSNHSVWNRESDLEIHRDSIVLSVSCGNTHYTWALHEPNIAKSTRKDNNELSQQKQQQQQEQQQQKTGGQQEEHPSIERLDAFPTLLWRTQALGDDLLTKDPCSLLEHFLPAQLLLLLFGTHQEMNPDDDDDDDEQVHNNNNNNDGGGDDNGDNDEEEDSVPFRCTKLDARQCAIMRRIPILYVYVISTNPRHEHGVRHLLRDLPKQLVVLQSTDFYTAKQGSYPTFGVDRAATMKAAACINGVPALVMDGGTAWTYTSVDVHGNIQGGGILPGLHLQLKSLSQYTGALPMILPDQVKEVINSCKSNQQPLPFIAQNTEQGMLTGVLSGLAAHASSTVELWQSQAQTQLAEASTSVPTPSPATKLNTDRKVLVTGGDGTLICDLLAPHHSYIVSSSSIFTGYPPSVIVLVEYAVHQGIRYVLNEKSLQSQQQPQSDDIRVVRNTLLGLRVARPLIGGGGAAASAATSSSSSKKKDESVVRGSVAALQKGPTIEQDLVRIVYDDLVSETVGMTDLYDALLCYERHGEVCFSQLAQRQLNLQSKQHASARGATLLLNHIPSLRNRAVVETAAVGPSQATTATTTPVPQQRPRSIPAAESDHHQQSSNDTNQSSKKNARRDSLSSSSSPPKLAQPRLTVPSLRKNPRVVVGLRIVRRFADHQWYYGTISEFFPRDDDVPDDVDLWHVKYDDGESEDLEATTVVQVLKSYQSKCPKDPNPLKST